MFKGRIISVKPIGKASDAGAFCLVWAIETDGVCWVHCGMFTALPKVGDTLEGEYPLVRAEGPVSLHVTVDDFLGEETDRRIEELLRSRLQMALAEELVRIVKEEDDAIVVGSPYKRTGILR